MIQLFLPTFFLFSFGFFNLFGIRAQLGFTMLINFVVGTVLFFSIKKIGWKFFQSNAALFYWIFIGILLFTYMVGLEVKGSKRWIDFFFFRFQGSEFFKIFFILFFADFFSKISARRNLLFSLLLSLFYFLLPTVIIFKQPDLGNAMVFVFIFLVMLFFSPIPKKKVLHLIGGSILLLPFGWFFLKEYQKARMFSFFQPHLDTQQNAYNMIQAMITIGSGRFLGRGLGLGTQSKLFFLPENSTDFAFSSLVEQFGFTGGILTIILFGVVLFILLRRAHKFVLKTDESGKFIFLYILGLVAFLFFQILVNVGMNLGVLPIAGIALPFISYGGSMIVSLMMGFALIPLN